MPFVNISSKAPLLFHSLFSFGPGYAEFKPPTGLPTIFDPSYVGVGKALGLEIWRVEKLAVVKKAASDESYKGKLYTGDSYIILQTKVPGSS